MKAAVPIGPPSRVRAQVLGLLAERGYVITTDEPTTVRAHRVGDRGCESFHVMFGPESQFVTSYCSDETTPGPEIFISSPPTPSHELKRAWLERFQPADAERIAAVAPVTTGAVFDRCFDNLANKRKTLHQRENPRATTTSDAAEPCVGPPLNLTSLSDIDPPK